MGNVALQVEGLGKMYRIGVARRQARTPWQAACDLGLAPFGYLRRVTRPATADETFWALRDIGFSVARGEAVGIIGRNGAGKSTLLKILSHITEPTHGRALLYGRVASLLEVGTGFHPELTGRENVYLNGAILGMSRAEIAAKFDEIVAFAEVERFLDTPVKRYSSGMYVRLAFAVAAHLDPEIMLIDEVLAVGDLAFQEKCLGKMTSASSQGRTVLFVSHNMGAITHLCPRSIYIDHGHLVLDGATPEVIARYMSQAMPASTGETILERTANGASFTRISVRGTDGRPTASVAVTADFAVRLEYSVARPLNGLEVTVQLLNRHNATIFASNLSNSAAAPRQGHHEPGQYEAEVRIPGQFLAPSTYKLSIGLHRPNVEIYDLREHVLTFHVVETGSNQYGYEGVDIGAILVDLEWRMRPMSPASNGSDTPRPTTLGRASVPAQSRSEQPAPAQSAPPQAPVSNQRDIHDL